MDEKKRRTGADIVEPTVVLWATFLGLAVANALRIAGYRFGLVLLLTALLATVAINIVAALTKALASNASKVTFYAGLCGAVVGFLATAPIYSPNPEQRLNCYAYERTVTRGSARVGAGLLLGGIAGVGLGHVLSRHGPKT